MSKLLFVSAICVALTGVMAGQTPTPELKVGDKAPEFSLPGTDGKTHKLSDYAGKHVVVAWYPAAFTGGCTQECRSFRDAGTTIKQYNVEYFMASVDTPEKNAEFAKMEQANFPLLSDPQKTVAAAYGVLNPRGTANRWTFYIGPDGRILFIDKTVSQDVANAGQKLAAKLAELNVPKK
jgi:peroxiredoxin Q/BCP